MAWDSTLSLDKRREAPATVGGPSPGGGHFRYQWCCPSELGWKQGEEWDHWWKKRIKCWQARKLRRKPMLKRGRSSKSERECKAVAGFLSDIPRGGIHLPERGGYWALPHPGEDLPFHSNHRSCSHKLGSPRWWCDSCTCSRFTLIVYSYRYHFPVAHSFCINICHSKTPVAKENPFWASKTGSSIWQWPIKACILKGSIYSI